MKIGIFLVSLTTIATIAYAKPAYEERIVYKNSSGQVTGGKTVYCSGSVSRWGNDTANSTWEYVYRKDCLGTPGDED